MIPTAYSTQRAKRFSLRLPLRYRDADTRDWHVGTTENISCAGVLFRGRHRMAASSPIEVALPLPPQLAGPAPLTLMCRGSVVRAVSPKLPLLRSGIAAQFSDYHLVREPLAPAAEEPRLATDDVHRFNNLVAIVLGNAELVLTHTDLPPDVLNSIVRIRRAAEEIAALVRGLNNGGL